MEIKLTPNTAFASGIILAGLSFVLMSSQSAPKDKYSPHRTITAAMCLILASSVAIFASNGEEMDNDQQEQKQIARTKTTEQRIMDMEADLAVVEREHDNEDQIDELEQEFAMLGAAAPLLMQMANISAGIEAGNMAIYNSYGFSGKEEKPALPMAGNDQTSDTLDFYNWDDVEDEASGIIIVGNTGYGKTSVACWLAGHLTKNKPAQMLALDPHASRNPLWKQLEIPVISSFEGIEAQIELLIELLDDRRELPENGDPVIVFADEINSCLINFEQPQQMEIALKRLGAEGRKYDIVFIALNQSPNVEDLPLSAAMRNNYFLLALGAAARSLGDRWRNTDPRKQHLNSVAYPCAVGGCVPTQIAVHPTHADYSKFVKKGNPPKNIQSIQKLSLTIPLAEGWGHLYSHFRQQRRPQPKTLETVQPFDNRPPTEAQQRLQQIKQLREQGQSPQVIIKTLWNITPNDGDRWEYVKGIYLDMCQILEIPPEDPPGAKVSAVDTENNTPSKIVSAQKSNSTATSSGENTLDTYPNFNGLPTENELLQMLQDTTLAPGEFIKRTLKLTKGERYRLGIRAIRYVVRRYGDFQLMEKFQKYL
ncbi:ATP-binding protein [Halotia branconii]|uniref:ATP-binding protein n=1 Tax=Halotia branconii CENA392 TaxID=1539056 RepID=A0AAJ6NSM6_9CYAN|nr:ATP-binding protein [Halotia branconii]WGV25978.1 ATP-binding protein [Halotia branconii CENA392]